MLQKKMSQISKLEKKMMKDELGYFRNRNENASMKTRLSGIPFHYSDVLFNLSPGRNSPCTAFGRQLVLKIIDELLDEG